MTFKEFIETKYDIRDRIKTLKSDPIKDFVDSDIFPCDFVGMEDGHMVKMLYYADGSKEISVFDLLSYNKSDIDKIGDKDLSDIYNTYTSLFDFEGDNILDMNNLSSVRLGSLKSNHNRGN